MSDGQLYTIDQAASLNGEKLPQCPNGLPWELVQAFREEGDVLVPYANGKPTSHPRIAIRSAPPPVGRDALLAWVEKEKGLKPKAAATKAAAAAVANLRAQYPYQIPAG